MELDGGGGEEDCLRLEDVAPGLVVVSIDSVLGGVVVSTVDTASLAGAVVVAVAVVLVVAGVVLVLVLVLESWVVVAGAALPLVSGSDMVWNGV